jgi:hypothetical protein
METHHRIASGKPLNTSRPFDFRRTHGLADGGIAIGSSRGRCGRGAPFVN